MPLLRFLCLLTVLGLVACQQKDPDIHIGDAYAFATAPSARNGAAFLSIHNDGGADRLLSASADVSERVEMHDMIMEDGTMRMRALDGLDIPGGETVTLAPQGKHIMFMNLTAPLTAGESFDLTLTFETSGEMTFPVMISAPGSAPQADAPDHHGDDGHHH